MPVCVIAGNDTAICCFGLGELLSLVWNNFLSNAIQFTPAGGAITVRLFLEKRAPPNPGCTADNARFAKAGSRTPETQSFICVSVQDTGCGMDERTKAHVFDKFFQGDTSHAAQGNGLGLALAARVAAICGGTLSVESAPGTGSTFLFACPAQIGS